jgi:hypothetical protein
MGKFGESVVAVMIEGVTVVPQFDHDAVPSKQADQTF